MICPYCGKQINDNTRFCPECGAPFADRGQQFQTAGRQYAPQYQAQAYAGAGDVRLGVPSPGFSDRVNHPEILAAIKKSRKAAWIFEFILVPLPLLGFLIYSRFGDGMETKDALIYGGIVSALFLLFALYSFFKERAKNTYDAVVIDKKSKLTYRHKNSEESRETVMQYTTIVRKTNGKKKKIVEYDGSQVWAYDYLDVGEAFRYHPQFHFPYEKYDKSRAGYIACVSCSSRNPVEADRCLKCGLPLLK